MKLISRKEAKELGLKRYFTGRPCKHEHVSERFTSNQKCVECGKLSERERVSRSDVKEKRSEYSRSERAKELNRQCKQRQDRGKVNATHSKWLIDNPEQLKKKRERDRAYRKANPEKAREYYHSNKSDPNRKAARAVRAQLNRLKRYGLKKARNTVTELGYTALGLKHALESQFKDGMAWDNYGEWHIDHIKPIKAFIDEGITDPAIINALDNLQPLWAKDNLSKGAKYDE